LKTWQVCKPPAGWHLPAAPDPAREIGAAWPKTVEKSAVCDMIGLRLKGDA
jgi:hypothetical protein